MTGFTISSLARVQGVPPRSNAVEIRVIEMPKAIPRELYLIYMRVVDEWWRLAKSDLLPAYAKAIEVAKETERRIGALRQDSALSIRDDLRETGRTVEQAATMLERVVATLTAAVTGWAVGVEEYHRDQFVGAVYSATRVDLGTVIYRGDVQTTLEAVILENMSLIRDVSETTRRRIAQIFYDNYRLRTPLREVAKQIADAVGISRRRAQLIASDQTNKLAGALDEQRQLAAGIEEFEWVHSGKVNYRPEHKARDGKIYEWRKARRQLNGDLPGYAINCGCKAKAVFRF